MIEIKAPPVARAGMLIRRPVADVFEAFVDPDVTTKFWFSRSSGRLQTGKTVRWYWDVYNVSAEVRVRAIEKDRRILIEWGDENSTSVEWTFTPRSEDTTYVSITNQGFTGNGDEILNGALDAVGGFSLLVASAKAWLEHGIELNVVADRL